MREVEAARARHITIAARGARRAIPHDAGAAEAVEPGRRRSPPAKRFRSRTSSRCIAARAAARRTGAPSRASETRDRQAGGTRSCAAADKPDVIVTVSKAHVGADGDRRRRPASVLRAGDDRQRARPAADRRVEGQRRAVQSRRSATTRTCSGTPIRRTPRRRFPPGPNNPGRRRLDRHLEASTTACTARRSRRPSAGPRRTAASG